MIAILIRAALVLGVLVYAAGAEGQVLMTVETKVYSMNPRGAFPPIELGRDKAMFTTMEMCQKTGDRLSLEYSLGRVRQDGDRWTIFTAKQWVADTDVLFYRVWFCSPAPLPGASL